MRNSQASKNRLLRRLLRYMQVRVRCLATSLFLVVLFLGAAILPTFAHVVTENLVVQSLPDANMLDQQGRQFYQTEQFAESVSVWQRAAIAFQSTGDELGQAMVLSNLSLAYQQLGQWDEAEEAIQQAIVLTFNSYQGERSPILAQALDVQGRLYLSRGQAESAVEIWQQAADIYTQLGDETLLTRNQINQAQALQSLGFYRQAQEQLREVEQTLQSQPDSALKVTGLRSLGNVLRVMGNPEGAQQVLQQSFAIAESISDSQSMSDTLLSLGDVARTQQDYPAALTFYQRAAETAPAPLPRISAQLRQFSLLLEDEQLASERGNTAEDLFPQILQQLADLPPSRRAVYARINLAESMMGSRDWEVGIGQGFDQVIGLLNTAVQQARKLEDSRAEAYALGVLGQVNERHQRWGEAENLTQEALFIAQQINVPDLAYRWQWQLGRLLKQRGEEERAIAAYQTAVENLNLVRNDLLSVDSEVQFSFRDDVEPVYRELVELLITSGNSNEVRQDYLEQAIRQVNALQVSELENFLRCNLAIATDIPQVDPTAAIFYPIILPSQLAVILRLPETGQLQIHINAIAQTEVEQTLDQLRQELGRQYVSPEGEALSQQVYDWLIRPFSSALAASNVETLVFVLDAALRNVPMAALHDGQQHLVEQYAIALTPSLQLFAPEPLTKIRLNALTFGLSEVRSNFPPHQNFTPLQNVETELQVIQAQIPSEVFLNQEFTQAALEEQVSTEPFSVVHLATHGQFSSDPQQTFVLAWDGQIDVNTLSSILQRRDQSSTEAIELLILSACQTADGDDRATLGLAGIAVQSGARSTLATLWNIDDRATAELISRFYQELSSSGTPITRAEALRRAQVALIQSGYPEPLFWSPYVLVGNWL
ncbi:CHAT domain-containing protein [Leptolyngbya sp. FACHB-671]|uniref:CHAT domain-containing protein n=1 Tax=Leptolyngbya sp. FACHB-671 TaxID=2692812 RepID=UPI0018F00141